MRRLVHRFAVGAGDEPATGQSIDAGQIVAGEYRDHARRSPGLAAVDGANPSMRMRRAQKIRPRLGVMVHVVGVASRAGEKSVVFLAPDRLPNRGKFAGAHGYFPIAAAPCFTALTML